MGKNKSGGGKKSKIKGEHIKQAARKRQAKGREAGETCASRKKEKEKTELE